MAHARPGSTAARFRRLRHRLVAVGAVGILTGGLVVGGVVAPSLAATGQVTGTVFRDFNQNGVYNATAGADGITDSGVAGATVRAFGADGTQVGTATSSATGAYSLPATSLADGTPLRLEFTPPAGYLESASGGGNGTSVQFTTVGATGVNYGVHKQGDFSAGDRTPIITAINANGLHTGSASTARAITAILPETATRSVTDATRSTVIDTLATFGEVGAVWGTAVEHLGGNRYAIWASAVVKRHSDYGPQGIAGLYRIEVTVGTNDRVTRTSLQSFNLAAGGINFGTVARDLVDRGGSATIDAAAWSAVGKVGIGGIAYDDGTLYVVNLQNRNVLAYDTANIAAGPRTISLTIGANERPWAIEVHDGRLYVGVTNTANVAAGSRVLSAPVAASSIATTTLAVPLDYERGIAWDFDNNPVQTTGQPNAQWHVWRDQDSTFITEARLPGNKIGSFRAWAQPILSDFAFDDGGNLVLGYTDRFTLQLGAANRWFDGTGSYTVMAAGDVLFAGRNATTGAYALESNGVLTGTGSSGAAETRTRSLTAPGNTTVGAGQTARAGIQGPGGMEFFEDSNGWNGAGGFGGEGVVHDETVLGSVEIVPGTNLLTSTSMDAAYAYNVGGNRWNSLADGHSVDAFDQYANTETAYFRKAGGLGGVSALLADAPIEIGNRVWYDADRDGVQDANEPAIVGATVELLGATGTTVLATTTTNSAGTYVFSSSTTAALQPDTAYRVRFTAPTGSTLTLAGPTASQYTGISPSELALTVPNVGTDDAIDSDAVQATRIATVTTGAWGQNDHTIDAGFFRKTYAIGDVTWRDLNRNGIQDAGEPPLAGVTVRLLGATGDTVLATRTTDAAGRYLFDNLTAGTYRVEFAVPTGYFRTQQNAQVGGAAAPTVDSDAAVSTGRTGPIVLNDSTVSTAYTAQPFTASQGVDPRWDAGYITYTPAIDITKADSVGNGADSSATAVDVAPAGGSASLVFTVTNNGDEPLTNVNVTDAVASGSSGTVSALSCTAPGGGSAISLPWAGPFAPGASFQCTAQLTGVTAGTPHLDTATATGTGTTSGTTVSDSDPYNAVALTYAIGDRVWVDRNGNGIQDTGETGLAGVTVTLLDGDGDPIPGRTVTTGASGDWLFDDLPAGTYEVQYTLPGGYRYTQQEVPGSPGSDSDPATGTGRTGPIVLGPGNSALTPRPGVTATQGIDPTWDAGVIPLQVSVGDYVWVDLNENGLQDAGEPGLSGVTVVLTGPGGGVVTDVFGNPVAPAVTNGSGAYSFTGLPPLAAGESYTVTVDTAASPVLQAYAPATPGVGPDRGADSSTGSAASGELTDDGDSDTSLDFGFVPLQPAIHVVKTDADGDDANSAAEAVDLTADGGATALTFTVQNTGDEPLVNVSVTDAVTAGGATVTGIDCLFPGGSTGTTWGGPFAIGGEFTCSAQLSGVVPGDLHTDVVTATGTGQFDGTVATDTDPFNALVQERVSVGDFVWEDVNGDGVQQAGEPGIGGVWVEIVGPDGAPAQNVFGDAIGEQQTAADGSYAFTDLPALAPGESYTVRVDQIRSADALAAFLPTQSGQGTPATDSSTGSASSGDLVADGDSDDTLDFGFVRRTYAIGDRVWIDTDRDGVQDLGEPSLEGVGVVLLNGAGAEVATTTTDADGLYLFDELLPGDYQLRFEPTAAQAALYRFTGQDAGDDDAADSDAAVDTGLTAVFPVGPGTVSPDYLAQPFAASEGVDATHDAGVVLRTYAVGDRVWVDTNRNGVQDDGEPSLGGVTAVLIDAAGDEIARDVTDADGLYLFDQVPGGDYTVRFELTDEQDRAYRFTEPGLGGDGALDSDAATATGTTAPFTVGAGTVSPGYTAQPFAATDGVDADVDAGVIPRTYAIGDRVWEDVDRDGIQDPGEASFPGVTVVLRSETGAELARTVTDADGRYLFDLLPEGAYRVHFELTPEQLVDHRFSPTTAGSDPAVDSDASQEDGTSALIQLGPDTVVTDYTDQPYQASEGIDPTWDAGVETRSYAIGDRVWIDTDRNGIQDAGEPSVAGMTVTLLDGAGNPLSTTQTNAQGYYLFDQLPAGQYAVRFEPTTAQLDVYRFTLPNADSSDTADSDAEVLTGTTATFDLGPDTVSTDYTTQPFLATEGVDSRWDAGLAVRTYAVGDRVWLDGNGDGLQTAGEPSLPGVTVVLLNGSGAEVARTVTGANGLYLFDELQPGTYEVAFELTPAQEEQFHFTAANAGTDDAIDSDAAVATGRTGLFPVGVGTVDPEYTGQPFTASEGVDPSHDAGLVADTFAIGDRVWIDGDRDGVQDAGEPSLAGVTVVLLNGDGVEIGRTVTNADGLYLFDYLPEGEYELLFELTPEQQAAYRFTPQGVGSDDADSDVDPATGRTGVFPLGPGTVVPGYTAQPVGASEGIDPSHDAGLIARTYAIGDRVWIDEDRDGVQDAGEPSLEGVRVVLLDGDGNELSATFTTAAGLYLFDVLPAGDYQLRFELTAAQQELYRFTQPLQGGDAALDSDAEPGADLGVASTSVFIVGPNTVTSDYTAVPFLASEGVDPTRDAGVIARTYAIGDRAWLDIDRDGVQGPADLPLRDVTVVLYDGTGAEVARTITGNDGLYLFDLLPAGTYEVHFELSPEEQLRYRFTDQGVGGDDALDSDADATTGYTGPIVLGPGTVTDAYADQPFEASEGIDPSWDAGIISDTYAIGDRVWIDENRNGVQDAGELPLVGTTVVLLAEDGDVLATTVTDADGLYLFDNLVEAEYAVRFELTEEQERLYRFTAPTVGDDVAVDSDAVPADGTTALFQVGPGTTDPLYADQPFDATEGVDATWDAGVIARTYAIGDRVWIDADRDGVQDVGEASLAGVVVTLLDGDGDALSATTTNADGRYLFDSLPPGAYQVRFELTEEQQERYLLTAALQGVDAGLDSDAATDTGLTAVFELGFGTTDEDYADQPFLATDGVDASWDAGVVARTYAVGDRVWYDRDDDGRQDEGEPSVPGVTVVLLDDAGAELDRTTTDGEGLYRFDQLEADEYAIRFELTDALLDEGYRFTFADRGDAAGDSDAGADGTTGAIVLGPENAALVTEGVEAEGVLATQGIDPTWDAGISLSPELPPAPIPPSVGGIPDTGGSAPWLLSALAALLLTGGAVLVIRKRRDRGADA